ncbi:MAG: hypothetical protein WBC56_09485, partial [Methanoregula sp.]|uniref:hypothetical protein n=2 Tax=Methanoregula sp. TaxID=2052170 RepID=UPI003C75E531
KKLMTRMDEVVQQIEAVIDDNECPATLGELMTIKRILAELTRQHAHKAEPDPHTAAAVAGNSRFFPGVVYDYLRDYERRRPAGLVRPAPVISCCGL